MVGPGPGVRAARVTATFSHDRDYAHPVVAALLAAPGALVPAVHDATATMTAAQLVDLCAATGRWPNPRWSRQRLRAEVADAMLVMRSLAADPPRSREAPCRRCARPLWWTTAGWVHADDDTPGCVDPERW